MEAIKIKQFKIRASACGQIMTNDRSGKSMGKTAKTYCEQWLKEQLYNRRISFSSKYTQKGLIVEDNSLDYIAEQLGYGMLLKNEQYFENDYMTGTPDIILKNEVIDAKNSWDFSTFPLLESDIPNSDYNYQLQVYMELCGVEKAKLVYVLSDTPPHLIEKEAFYYCKNNGYDELDEDVHSEFIEKMTYSDVSDQFKLKVYEIEKNDNTIIDIINRVNDCRLYIYELINKLNIKVQWV